jgi:hypothetical protein
MGADRFSNPKLTLRQRISGAIMSSGIKIETSDLGKLADTMEKTVEEHLAENPAVSSLLIPIESKSDFDNKVYAAVVGICEEREALGSYTGNGHHLAQEITESVVNALIIPTFTPKRQ